MKYFRILHDMRLSFYICSLFGILLLGFQVVIYFSLFRSVMLKQFRVLLHDMRLSYVINAYFFGKLLLGFKVVIYMFAFNLLSPKTNHLFKVEFMYIYGFSFEAI